jgi:hypothetical protein
LELTQAQKSLIEKAQSEGGGELGTGLTDKECAYLTAVIIKDLQLIDDFPKLNEEDISNFYNSKNRELAIEDVKFIDLIKKLISIEPNADTYFSCLARLQKSRLKYSKIIEYQALPTMEQVGPRSLLQYGQMDSDSLAALILWRKWIYDIDNRAGQETGYLFEPIIAYAIGGASFSSSKSPIKRHNNRDKGRQVDCIRNKEAYEIKIRVTIAASGQGRWREELSFPRDCQACGYKPILIVLDSTSNPKLFELQKRFAEYGGESYIGNDAWDHLEEMAGMVMGKFLENYVRTAIDNILASAPETMPSVSFKMENEKLFIAVEEKEYEFPRANIKIE